MPVRLEIVPPENVTVPPVELLYIPVASTVIVPPENVIVPVELLYIP